ncbi:MAG: DsrE family protein [Nitrospirae bacterium]|nr:DsrE family protein [Nitrospirota bacterium]
MRRQHVGWTRSLLWITVGGLLTFQPPTWGADLGEDVPANRPHRVVMHLNSGDEKVQRGILNNITHLYQELGPQNLTVELVVHGAGLPFLTKKGTASAAELADLKKTYGINYTACSNTMKTMQVTREDLISEVGDTVPAMVRLMERQEQGWVYIKP